MDMFRILDPHENLCVSEILRETDIRRGTGYMSREIVDERQETCDSIVYM